MNIGKSNTRPFIFVGLDVHKNTIFLSARSRDKKVVDERVFSTKDLNKLHKFLSKLAKKGPLKCCYEASGAGFYLYRVLRGWDVDCEVVASSLIPHKPGDKRKCDRLDARNLADYYQADLLTMVNVPTAEMEAARGVVRCRQAFRKKVTQSKHQINKFLQTKGEVYREGNNWTGQHRAWLATRQFNSEDDAYTFSVYLSFLELLEKRLQELDQKIEDLATREVFREPVRHLCGHKGVKTLTAMVLVTELGDVRRFKSPRHLMSYVGLTPSLYQSGESGNKAGSITKAGSARCRHVLVQAAWNYISRPKVSADLRGRQNDLPAWLVDHSWETQERLYKRFRHLEGTVGRKKAIVAIARELMGFLGWSLYQVQKQT